MLGTLFSRDAMKCYLINILELGKATETIEELSLLMPVSRREKLWRLKTEKAKLAHLGVGLLMSYAALRGETRGEPQRLSGRELVEGIYGFLEVTEKQETKALPDIRIEKRGKPYYCPPYEKLYFNASHSGDFVFFVVSDREVGCDLQIIEDRKTKASLAGKIMTAKELVRYETTVEMEQEDCFYEAWCKREALGKYTGDGVAGLLMKELSPLLQEEGLTVHKTRHYLESSWYYFAVCEKGKVE